MITVQPVTPEFVAVVGNVDLKSALTDDVFAEIEAAFERYAVLVFHDQPLTDDEQRAFAQRFGPLGIPLSPFISMPLEQRRLKQRELADISNVDEKGELLTETDARRLIQLANMLWHSDATFKRVPAKMSMLCAQSVVAAGGETEFADMRAAWNALPEARKRQVEHLVAEHDYFNSRLKAGLDPSTISPERRAMLPPVPQVLVRTHPVSGRKSLYLGSHITRIYDMPETEGRRLLEELTEHATQPAFVYRHRWAVGDLVMWDNRCTMHRGRPHDPSMRRVMRRATASDVGPTVPEDWRPASARAGEPSHVH